jgi:ribosomal protein S18 acetylase RimI-like enzyme
MPSVRPLSSDPALALALARRAILAQNQLDDEGAPFLSAVERDVADGSALGVLRFDGAHAVGIALWEAPSPLGATVQVMFLQEGRQTPADYRAFYGEITAAVGPVALAPGRLVGLTDSEEAEVMGSLGFARFARSEMRFPPGAVPPPPTSPAPAGLREARPDDLPELARLHELAYRDHFDRYLFLSDLDPTRDAELEMGGLLGGRHGEFLPWASWVVEREGRAEAASLVVRAPYGPLIADVMVDPTRQGGGLGRAVLGATIRSLRERQESVIVLNVTEGNSRAIRLYETVGFVRSLGPSHGWYSTQQIPVSSEHR